MRGGVLLDPRTGRPLAASGEAVPLTGVDVPTLTRSGTADIPPRLATSVSAGARLLFFARVAVPTVSAADRKQDHARGPVREQGEGEGRFLLVVSEEVAALTVHGGGRTGQIVDRDGKVLASSAATGAALPPDTKDRALSSAAADAGLHAGDDSGSMLGDGDDGHDGLRRVAGWASVAAVDGEDDTSGLGLTVLTFRDVPPTKDRADHTRFAMTAAGALAVIAMLVTLVLWSTVQRPLLRLYLSAARLARGAGGTPEARAELARPVPAGAFGEPGRAGRALESIRRQLLGEAGPEPVRPTRRRPGLRSLVLVCALVIAAWGVPLLFLLNRVPAAQAAPQAVVADQQARTESAADRVRQSLGQSYTDLTAMASAIVGVPRERATELLRRERADHPTYRSLYVLDHTGAIVLRVGKEPLRASGHAPSDNGITQVDTSGKTPVVAAYAQIKTAKNDKARNDKARNGKAKNGKAKNDTNVEDTDPAVVVAEIGVDTLNDLVARSGLGRVWLTDERHRVLAASVRFQAFQALPSRGLTRLAAKTEAAPGGAGSPASAVLHGGRAPGQGPSVAAAAPLAQTGPAAALGWRVVSAKPAAALKLASYELQAHTMLAGLLALAVGAACLSWLHIVVVRPLRTLTGCAERLAEGDRRTVLYPVHHDECGSVTRNLELLRQALAERDRGAEAGAAAAPVPPLQSGSAPSR
ncbi:HAMP domain-containing protein [Streptomyces sp. SAJ15]|uniref:HAMP domain-containing protein n=1 Tax=Streptomyces sp. SAJ15 TaxID=2011095 RepID=UPI0021B305B4|nr:HAMP domain-containing protein [Streptomyces sp. SAJ15]